MVFENGGVYKEGNVDVHSNCSTINWFQMFENLLGFWVYKIMTLIIN